MGPRSHWAGEGYVCACLCTCMCVWMVRACAVLSRFNVSDSFVSPWTVTPQTPVSLGVSRQECWSGLPFPPPGDLPNSGTEPVSLLSSALAAGFFTSSTTWCVCVGVWYKCIYVYLCVCECVCVGVCVYVCLCV